jgi:hypothetical protein
MSLKQLLPVIPAMALLGISPSWPADLVAGRISYVYPDGRHFLVDDRRVYELASGADAAALRPGKFVALILGSSNRVTRVAPLPESLAGPRRASS